MSRLLFLILFILIPVRAFPDIIHLKSGRALEGEVAGRSGAYIDVRLKTITARYALNEILSVEKKPLPEDFYAKEAPQAKDAVTQKELSGTRSLFKKVAGTNIMQAEGYSSPDGAAYELKTRATYTMSEGKDAVEVEGETSLPEGSLLYVAIKHDAKVIESYQVMVVGHKFMVKFGPFSGQLAPGEYRVETKYLSALNPKKKTSNLSVTPLETVSILTVSR